MTTPHDYFGIVELDEQARKYQAKIDFAPNHKVSVAVNWAGISPTEALKRAQAVCDEVRGRESEYRNEIARTLLGLYNGSWRDGEALDTDGFIRRISLSNMEISPVDFGSDRCVTLGYADGDLFAGHYIEVFLDADFNYVKSQIAG